MTRLDVYFARRCDDDDECREDLSVVTDSDGNVISSPLIPPPAAGGGLWQNPLSFLAAVVTALRRSLIVCSSVPADDGPTPPGTEIGWPTNVRHISHVTINRFEGFLGLPGDLLFHLPHSIPGSSVNVFGVSVKSMQCSYDNRGNSVPKILLLMQRHLYSQGGLQAEGIFRINAENGQDIYLRDQLGKGVVPLGIDVHCLAGLIKAWFRELPSGVLDLISPDEMMQCSSEEECSHIVRKLPPAEAALLDWAINMMVDVVEYESHNKMNARNIAMVFAPNMTQMSEPLTALVHAVQVMNFLRTLILKTLHEREETCGFRILPSYTGSTTRKDDQQSPTLIQKSFHNIDEETTNIDLFDKATTQNFLFNNFYCGKDTETFSQEFMPVYDTSSEEDLSTTGAIGDLQDDYQASYSCHGNFGDGSGWTFLEGVRKLCRYPLFHSSKPAKDLVELGATRGCVT